MHRSGTSCLAGILEESGVYLGDVSNHNKHNKKGNKENPDIMSFNDELLHFNNAKWDTPPKSLHWSDQHKLKANNIINHIFGSTHRLWGFKDPRTLLTLDFWHSMFSQPKFIGTIRHPSKVTQSLQKRDKNISDEAALALWYDYNQRLLLLLQTNAFPVVSFDAEKKDYLRQIDHAMKHLSVEPPKAPLNFFDSTLRSSSLEKDLPQHIMQCYEELLSFCGN